jgi:hypothetical protein
VRLYALLARGAPRAVVFRRGPSKRVLLVAWRTDTDIFEEGQWLAGRIYERRCDLSPSGERLIYFAASWKPPFGSWTAVSRPPWLTALALWPKGDAWGGGGAFDDERAIRLNHGANEMSLAPGFRLPRSIQMTSAASGPHAGGEDSPVWDRRMAREGWVQIRAGKERRHELGSKIWIELDPPAELTKPRPGEPRTVLHMRLRGIHEREGAWYVVDHEVVSPKRNVVLERTDWADWDRNGDLLYARAGALYRMKRGTDETKLLIDLSDRTFDNRPCPAHARKWSDR